MEFVCCKEAGLGEAFPRTHTCLYYFFLILNRYTLLSLSYFTVVSVVSIKAKPGDSNDDLMLKRSSCVGRFTQWMRNGILTFEKLEFALDLPCFSHADDALRGAWSEILLEARQCIYGTHEAW